MHEDCLYCDIARGRCETHVIHADRRFVVCVDARPIRPGHLHVIPRAHHGSFDELPGPLATGLMRLGQRLARVMKAELGVERVGFVMTGHGVAHAHAHLVPMHAPDDITSRRYIALSEVPTHVPERLPCAELDDMANRLGKRLAGGEIVL